MRRPHGVSGRLLLYSDCILKRPSGRLEAQRLRECLLVFHVPNSKQLVSLFGDGKPALLSLCDLTADTSGRHLYRLLPFLCSENRRGSGEPPLHDREVGPVFGELVGLDIKHAKL
jgi:hypothetical protein